MHLHYCVYTITVPLPYRAVSRLSYRKYAFEASCTSKVRHTGYVPYLHGDIALSDLPQVECDRWYDILAPLCRADELSGWRGGQYVLWTYLSGA